MTCFPYIFFVVDIDLNFKTVNILAGHEKKGKLFNAMSLEWLIYIYNVTCRMTLF